MITKQANEARTIRQNTLAKIAEVRRDSGLSAQGKRTAITALHDEAKTAISKLRQAESVELAATRSTLEASLFGSAKGYTGASLVSYRDAADRADERAKTPEAAEQLIRRALAEGDAELATAVARRSVEKDWHEPFAVWQNARRASLPDVDNIVAQLADIDEHTQTGGTAEAALRWTLPSPPEVGVSVAQRDKVPGRTPLNSYDADTAGFGPSAA